MALGDNTFFLQVGLFDAKFITSLVQFARQPHFFFCKITGFHITKITIRFQYSILEYFGVLFIFVPTIIEVKEWHTK